MRLKIFQKLFFTTSCVLFVTLTLVFVLLSVAVNDETAKGKYQIVSASCDIISDNLLNDGGVVDSTSLSLMNSATKVNSVDIFVVNQSGNIIACSCDNYFSNGACEHSATSLSESYLSQIVSDGKIELSSVGGIYDSMHYTYAKSIRVSNGDDFYIISTSSVVSAVELIKILFGMYAVAAIIPLIFMFVAEYSIVYRITRPLKYMSIAAKSIANGDFSKRIPVMSNDEIGELWVLFNRMTDSIARSEKTSKNFIANVSHELKTPMTTISGFIDGIIDGTIDSSKQSYYLGIVSDEVKRLSRLVQSMLNLSRLESGENILKQSSFKLSETILNVVISMEQKICDKNINITGLESLTENYICGDQDLLHQVVYNLVDNAVKFTPLEGNIDFSLLRFKDNIEFVIKNSGEGIAEKDIPHIFDKFYKSDKSRSNHKNSLGLGLYICKTVAELHNGSIKVESLQGEYTQFTLTLPLNLSKEINDERRN